MPINGLTADQLTEFLDKGVLHSSITIPVVATQQSAAHSHSDLDLTSVEKSVYDNVLRNLEEIGRLLGSVEGRQNELYPLDEPQRGDRFEMKRRVLFGHNILEVTRPERPNFYWRVAIRDSGEPDHRITGFYHGCSNGNLRDIKDAFEDTKRFFPAPGCKLIQGAVSQVKPNPAQS
jgi:hypothetical protein